MCVRFGFRTVVRFWGMVSWSFVEGGDWFGCFWFSALGLKFWGVVLEFGVGGLSWEELFWRFRVLINFVLTGTLMLRLISVVPLFHRRPAERSSAKLQVNVSLPFVRTAQYYGASSN